ncbi:MAG: ATP-grasp domain-containing protein [Candidatus Omnitrophica bacterium]|nr:ATP-grasp domain-containing protein [Candidatus Omnitrophota bacterium]
MNKKKVKKIVIAVGVDDVPREDTLDALRSRDSVRMALVSLGYEAVLLDITENDMAAGADMILSRLEEESPDAVFNIFEGFSDDSRAEITFAEILESSGIPFTGNGSQALEICLDKSRTRDVLIKNGVSVPYGFPVYKMSDISAREIRYPSFIKPLSEDASVGIDEMSFVTDEKALRDRLEAKLKRFPGGLVVEEFISGKEYAAGFFGEYPYELAGVSLLDFGNAPSGMKFLNYSSKWDRSSAEYTGLIPGIMRDDSEVTREMVSDLSRKAGLALGCSGYFRVDLREKDGELYVLDVNPNPDINKDAGFAKQCYAKGLSYEKMIMKIIEIALRKK